METEYEVDEEITDCDWDAEIAALDAEQAAFAAEEQEQAETAQEMPAEKSNVAKKYTAKNKNNKATPERERKTGVSIYLRPSVYEAVKRLARCRGTSAGQIIDVALDEYLDENREEIQAFEEFEAKMDEIKRKKAARRER